MVFSDFGEVIHSIPAPGYYSNGLAWDGNSLWVANIADASQPDSYWYRIFQVSPEDGEILTSFSTNPYFYHGLTYDGDYLWGEHNYTTIKKLNNTGESLQEFSAIPLAVGLAFNHDDDILFQSTTQPGVIYKFDINTQEMIGELTPDEPYEHGWGDLAFDGTYLWHVNVASDTIYKIDQYTGNILDEFPAPSNQCEGLTFDGSYLWTSDTNLEILYQIDIDYSHCGQCESVWMDDYWGEQCCDVAWNQWGFDCGYMEDEYGWDCTGCECPYDANSDCGDGYCNGDESIENCASDCTNNGCNTNNQVDDCFDDDCCPIDWIGDGYPDCEEPNNFGCDLSCYDHDGGDCLEGILGDINGDETLDILDIVLMINMILNSEYSVIADVNSDGSIDVLDIIIMVNILIGGLPI